MIHPSKFRTCHRKYRGISLIEILVVIGIVGILVSLIYPISSNLRKSAHNAQCIANIRYVGTAVLEFAANNNGQIMPRKLSAALEENKPKGVQSYWYRRLHAEGYIEGPVNGSPLNLSLFCPAHLPNGHPEVGSEMYGMRAWRGTAVQLDSYLSLNNIPNPSRFFIFADSVKVTGEPTQWYTIQLGDGQGNRVHLRHNNRANAFFADGSVQAMDEDYFSSLIVTEPEFTYRAIIPVSELP